MSLFPADFSVRDKVKRWVMIFSGFDKVEVTALEKILEQKQRLVQMLESMNDFKFFFYHVIVLLQASAG